MPFGIHVVVIEPGAYETAFTGNARQTRDLASNSPYRSAYDQFWQATHTALHADGRGDPRAVGAGSRIGFDDRVGRFRRLVGADAELVCGLKHQLPFDEFERTIRATLGLDQQDNPLQPPPSGGAST